MRLELNKVYITRDGLRAVRIVRPGEYPNSWVGEFMGNTEDVHFSNWNFDGSWLSPDTRNKFDLVAEVGTTL